MIRFYCEEVLAPLPTPKLEDHPLSAVRDCLFNILAATLNIGRCFSIRNLRTRHAVVSGTHSSRPAVLYLRLISQINSLTFYMTLPSLHSSMFRHDWHLQGVNTKFLTIYSKVDYICVSECVFRWQVQY